MTTEAQRPEDEARWTERMEADACGELSEAERTELDRLAAHNEERRQERLLLAAISRQQPIASEVSAADMRLIESTLALHARDGGRRKRAVWLAAGLLVPLAAAAAICLPRSNKAHTSPDETAPERDRTRIVSAPPRPPAEPEAARETTGAPESPEISAPAMSPASRPPVPSTAELLARGQRERSARNYGAAIRAYRQLLRLHPASAEARLAQLSLAQLQLAQGDAIAALAGFDAYERSGGALSQEAHYGKIQALRALGRTAEESAEIRRFTAHYPDSLQAAALKQRLGARGDQR